MIVTLRNVEPDRIGLGALIPALRTLRVVEGDIDTVLLQGVRIAIGGCERGISPRHMEHIVPTSN